MLSLWMNVAELAICEKEGHLHVPQAHISTTCIHLSSTHKLFEN